MSDSLHTHAMNDLQNLEIDDHVQQRMESRNRSRARIFTTLLVLVLDVMVASFTSGALIASLPQIAKSLSLPANLLLWPTSVNALTCASLLLLAGSVSDLVGAKRVWLVGSSGLGITIMACSLAQTTSQLIVFRALQGAASSLCLTTSASLLTKTFAAGRGRNVAFGCLGLSQPFGFSVGLVLGGVLTERLGWRSAWYASSFSYALTFVAGLYALPADVPLSRQSLTFEKLHRELDFVGAMVATIGLAMCSYALAIISADPSEVRRPKALILLVMSLLLVPVFSHWMRIREKQNKHALIPNSIWRSRSFTAICVMVLSATGIEDANELLSSLYFQNVQMTGVVQSSLRMLPMGIVGAVLSIATGLLVNSVSASRTVVLVSLLSAISPLLMALTNPKWPYWYSEFPSQLLMPLSIDMIITVGIILASEVFPEDRQALAAGVFNTAGQLGISIGLAVIGTVSRATTLKSGIANKASSAALLVGYKAGFWTAFVWTLASCAIGAFGLTKLGRVGLHRD